MATRRWGVSRGENMGQVTEGVGAAVAADTVELTVDLAGNMSKSEVLIAIEYLVAAIVADNWPPA